MDRATQAQRYLAELQHNPHDLTALVQLERLFDSDWSGLVDLLRTNASDAGSDVGTARLFLEASRIADLRVGDRSLGDTLLESAESATADATIKPELQIFRLAHDEEWDGLIAFLADAVEQLDDHGVQSTLYYRVGSIFEEVLQDVQQADLAYQWSLDLNPKHVPAFWARQSLAQTEERWEDYARFLVGEYEISENVDRQIEILLDLGEVYRDHLGQVEEAVQCFANVYEYDPSNERARLSLAALGYDVPQPELIDDAEIDGEPSVIEIMEDIEPLSEASAQRLSPGIVEDDGDDLLVSEPVLDLDDDRPVDLDRQSEIQLSEVELIEEEEDEEPVELSAVELIADDEIEEVEPQPADEPAEDDIVAAAEEALAAEPDADDEEVIALEEQAEDSEAEAIESEASEGVESVEPDESDVDEESEMILEPEPIPLDETHVLAAEELAAADEVVAPPEEIEPIAELAQTPTGAVDWNQMVDTHLEAAIDGSGQIALTHLVAATAIADRHQALGDHYGDFWETAVAQDIAPEFWRDTHFMYPLNPFWSDRLEDDLPAKLKGQIAAISLRDPERGAELGGDDLAELVADIDAANANWRKFQRELEKRHDALPNDEKQRQVYTALADIAFSTSELDKETDALRRLDRAVPGDLVVQSRLKRIYRQSEKWPAIIDILKSQLEAASSDAEKIDILFEMANVYRDKASHEGKSHDNQLLKPYKQILDLDPENTVALDELGRLYENLNRWSDLVSILESKVERATDDQSRVELLGQVAQLHVDRTRKQADALAAYEQVLEIEPENDAAATFLVGAYEKRREWEKLIDLKRKQLGKLDGDEKLSGLKEIAELASSKLRNTDIATELWSSVIEADSTDRDALGALETLHDKSKNYAELGKIIGIQAELEEDEEAKLKLYQKMGLLYADRLGDPELAASAWHKALEIRPDDLKSRKSLEKLLIEGRKWDELEEFYASKDQHAELVQLLSRLSGTMKEQDVKIDLLLRSANIVRDELGDVDRAEKDLERVLELDARNVGAAEALEPIYRANGNVQSLRNVYEIILESKSESEERLGYLEKLGALHADELDEPHGAYRWYAIAVREAPTNQEYYPRVEAAADQAGLFSALAETYQDVLLSSDDESLTAETQLRLARIFNQELAEYDDALEQYQAVLSNQPQNVAALEGLAEVYEKTARWDDLMSVYERRIELVDAPEDRVEILRGMAVISEEQAGDVANAIVRHNEALAIDPNFEPSLVQLHRLYRNEGQWKELADVISREISIVETRANERDDVPHQAVNIASLLPGDDVGEEVSEGEVETGAAAPSLHAHRFTEEEIERLINLNYELGVVSKDELNDHDTAVLSLATVLKWMPRHVDARAAIESYLEDADYKLDVAQTLEPTYEIHGDWERYIQTLEVRAESASDNDKVVLLDRIGETFLSEVGDPRRAFETFGRLLHIQPEHDRREDAYRIASALDEWDLVADLYQSVIPEIEDSGVKQTYLFEVADVYADELNKFEDARSALEQILEDDAQNPRALEELEQLFTRTEQWRDMLSVMDRKHALATTESETEALRFKTALLWEEKLDDRGEAIDIYQKIRDNDPSNVQSIEALNRLFTAESRWRDLAASLEDQLERSEEEAKHDVRHRLAVVLEQHLEEPGRAVDLYESVLEADPSSEETIDALERLMYAEGAPQGRVARILEPIYSDKDRWNKLIDVLEVQVATANEDSDRVTLLHRIAELQEQRAANQQAAFRTYSRALRHDVTNSDTLDHLYRIAGEERDFDSLVAVFEDVAETQENLELKRDFLRRAAAVHRDALYDVESASARLTEVLDIFPDDMESVTELETIYQQTQDWDALVQILVKKADLVEDADQKKALFHQAGQMYEEFLEQPDDAIDVYNRILEFDGADRVAIERLQSLYGAHEKWEELLSVYARKVDLSDSDDERKDLYYAMGDIHWEALRQPHDAIDTFRKVLEIDASETAALARLDALYLETEQWPELLEILQSELSYATLPADALVFKYRIGRLFEERLYDVPKAIETFKEILDVEPDHVATREALEAMVSEGEFAVDAASVLEPVYRNAEQWTDLIRVYELQIEATESVDRKVELYSEIGNIQERQLHDGGAAFQSHAYALRTDPSRDETLETLERLAGALGGWEVLVDVLDGELESTSDLSVQRNLNVRISRIYEEELIAPSGAIDRLNRVLEIEPEDGYAVAALDRLYQREARWEELAGIIQRRIGLAESSEEVLQLRLRQGRVFQSALDQPSDALDTYREILTEDEENPEAISALEEMFMAGQAVTEVASILEPHYTNRGEHVKLIEIYAQRLGQLDDRHERFDVRMIIANLCLNELQDPEHALLAYGNALVDKPDDEAVLEQLLELAAQTGEWGETTAFINQALSQDYASDEASVMLYNALGNIYATQLGQIGPAEAAYRSVLEYDQDDKVALEALDRIYDQQGRWEELTDVVKRRLNGLYEEEDVALLNTRLASIYQNQLADLDSASEHYYAVLDVDPTNRDALAALESIHGHQQQWNKMYDILERHAEVLDDPDQRAQKYGFMAQIAEEALERPADAIDLWKRVLETREDDLEALRQLRRLYLENEEWSELVDVLEREVVLTPVPEDQLELYQALGQIWGDYLGNEAHAMEAWKHVLEIDPFHVPALEALQVLYRREGDFVELSGVLSRMLKVDSLPPERMRELWAEQGEIQGDKLMEPEAAIDAWKQVLAYDVHDERALDNLERQYVSSSRWEEAAQILVMKLDTIEDHWDRIDLLGRIAEIWETQVGDPGRAADFYEQVLELDRQNGTASAQLESIYRVQDSPESNQKLAALYLDRAEQTTDDPDAFLESLRASARVYDENLSQPDNAFLVLLSAFKPETVEDEDLVSDLERLAARTNKWPDLVAGVESVLSSVEGSFEAASLHDRVGGWHYEQLGQPDEAIYHYQRALAADSGNLEVMTKLEGLYREVGDWQELARILTARVEATSDPDEQVSIWRRLGELHEIQMNDVDGAVAAYEQILEIDPSDFLALESLERIYEAYDRWTDLIDVMGRKAETTYDPDEQVAIKFRTAQIWEQQVGDVDRAIQSYNDVLAIDQTHVATLKELERVYTIHQGWDGLLGVYEQQLALSESPEEQIAIYGRQATLFEESFNDDERAIDSYKSVLHIEPQNDSALSNLKRLYNRKEQWGDFVDVVRQQAEVQEYVNPALSASTWNELARTQRDQVGDPNAAIDAFRRSVDIDPQQTDTWREFGALYEETADWHSAVECYNEYAAKSGDVQQRVETLHHIGFIYEANLQDDVQAEQYYTSALDFSTYQPTLLALRDLYTRRGDWANAVEILKRAEESSRDLTEKAGFLSEIGKIYESQMEDGVSALRYYEAALENDPANADAAAPLIDLYVGERRWERASPLLDRFLAESDGGDRETQQRRFKQHAIVSRELDRKDAALSSFRSAYEIDPNDTETLLGLSELLYERGEWEQAFQVLQTLQFNHLDALSTEQIVDIYFKSGEVKRQVGEQRRAIQMYQKVLEHAPNHKPSIDKLIEVYEAEENWEQVIVYTEAVLEGQSEPAVRFSLLSRIGDIWMQKLNRPQNATESYLAALDVDSNSVVMLRKLLDIFQKTQQWSNAVEILDKLVSYEESPTKRAKYLYTIAVILRDEIRDYAESAKYFELALDEDVKMLKSFEALDRIHTEAKEWKELERAYRRMIKRVVEHDDGQMEGIKILLWQNLGEIYRSRLNLVKSAISAYEAAVGLDPENEKIRLILAELYEKKSDNPDGAIIHHKALIKNNAFRIESYRALWKAYRMKEEYDKAWCMAAALTFLQNANEHEEEFYRRYQSKFVKQASAGINQEALKLLYHGPQDIVLMSMILGDLSQYLRADYAIPLKQWGVHKKKDLLSLDGGLMFCKQYAYVANVTGMAPPTLYLKQDRAIGMQNANSNPPSFVIGGDVMQNLSDRELMFIIAKKLAWARPEHYLGAIQYPTEFVRMLFMATMAVTDPSLGLHNQLGEQGAQWIEAIRRIPPQSLMRLQKKMRSYLSLNVNPDLSAWMTHADHTTNRFGLLLCGDLQIAASAIKNDMNPIGKATVKDKIKELVKFSISEEYFQLRAMLGLSIESR